MEWGRGIVNLTTVWRIGGFFFSERSLMKKNKSLRASPLECTDISEGPWAVYPLTAELAAAWGLTQMASSATYFFLEE